MRTPEQIERARDAWDGVYEAEIKLGQIYATDNAAKAAAIRARSES